MLDQEQWLLDNREALISVEKWQKTVNLLAEFFAARAAFLVQHTHLGYQVTVASQQSSNPYAAGLVIEPSANIFCRKIVETGELLYVGHAQADPYWDSNPEVHDDGFSSYLGVPVHWPNGTIYGTFCVMDYRQTDYQDTYLKLIVQLRDILEADLELIEAYSNLKELAITDELTLLYNRRGFNVVASQRLLLAKRMSIKLGLIYIDIDDFKMINDHHGHGVGDGVLKALSSSLRGCVRESDVLCRIGGDEFVALIAVSEHQADFDSVKQRINWHFSQQLANEGLPEVSVSMGFTPVTSQSLDQLIDQADKLMYQNKLQ
ncbi:MAG: GGDEF domain-containing protein [Cellvibrionaceae bacterium]